MSISAVAILFGDINREQVSAAIREAFPITANDLTLRFRDSDEGWGTIIFPEPSPKDPTHATHRQMVFMPADMVSDYGMVYDGARTVLNLNAWGSSTEILTAVLERFGGYLLASDANSSSDPDNWKLIAPPENVFEAINPKDRLKIELAKSLSPSVSAQLAVIADQPEAISSLLDTFATYQRDQAIVDTLEVDAEEPEMQFNGVDAKVEWNFWAGPMTDITLYWTLPSNKFDAVIRTAPDPMSDTNKKEVAPTWLVEHLKKKVSDDPDQTFRELVKHFSEEFPKHCFDDAATARAEAFLAQWRQKDHDFEIGGFKL